MTSQELKTNFFKYFQSKNHVLISSASLIPENDPTVLFTTAGMHPLVPYLIGEKHPAGKRLVDVQKCLRTGDIDEVGDTTHHTFFEMLGNWSLGDYFKEDAIKFSWEFLTKILKLDKNKLAVSVFGGDDNIEQDKESAKLWQAIGVTKIAYLGKKDNWWGPAGQTGPCGPDTEIFYWASSKPVPDNFDPKDKNWVEIWNNVLMQYNKKIKPEKQEEYDRLYLENKPIPSNFFEYMQLEQKNIDTGMGFERTLAILNGFDDNYKTELFWPIIEKIEALSGKKYEEDKKSFRIIADHVRSAVFILGDPRGVVPSNKAQGYVLRKLIRRAVKLLNGIVKQTNSTDNHTPNTVTLAKTIIKEYEKVYPELKENKNFILQNIGIAERKFIPILVNSYKGFNQAKNEYIKDAINQVNNAYESIKVFEDQFKNITKQIESLPKSKIKYMDNIFKKHEDHLKAIEEATKPALNQIKAIEEATKPVRNYLQTLNIFNENIQKYTQEFNKFKEYTKAFNTQIKKLNITPLMAQAVVPGKPLKISDPLILAKDAFDLYSRDGIPIDVIKDLAKEGGFILDNDELNKKVKKHQELSRTANAGMFKGGLADDGEMATKYHTATHLLHQALKDVLGEHVEQRGSNINAERLRFDFVHDKAMTEEEKSKVEEIVNQQIKASLPITYEEMSVAQAKKQGAIGIFTEKYGEKIKVYKIGDYSKEICGGPHVNNTNQLGKFRIKKEQSSSAGIRRIKAVLE